VVRNATNGQPLPGATVSVAGGDQTATADTAGRYRLGNLPPGPLTIVVSASGFIADRANVTVPPSGAQIQTFALSPALREGQQRVVLTWGNTPRDLDAHYWIASQPISGAAAATAPARTPTTSATTEIYYGNRGSLTTLPFVALDVDDTGGLGPETITLGQFVPGRYTYAVDQVTHTFTVPSGTGRWWHVFTGDGATGQITPVNRLTDSPPVR
jgi:hypothetical protein